MVRGRLAYNGWPTQHWISREEVSSPTVSSEGIFLTATVDACLKRDAMLLDVPSVYIQADVPTPRSGQDRITMKLTGILVDWLLELEPDTYGKYVVMENGVRTLYLIVTKAIYGMLIASVLWYKKFWADLLRVGSIFNDYDPCVTNRMISGSTNNQISC